MTIIGRMLAITAAGAVLIAGGVAAGQDDDAKGAAGKDAAPATIVLERNVLFDWEGEDDGTAFVHEDVEATLTLQYHDMLDMVASATLTIARPGHPDYAVTAEAGLSGYGNIGFFDFDEAGGVSVLFDAYTGGAHCCTDLHAVWLGGDGPVHAEIGMFDGEGFGPQDLDGDGVLEIVVRDDRFNYTFDAYAVSFPPAMILKSRDGEVYDASRDPRFRDVIEEDRDNTAVFCGGDEGWYAGACAALAANAALLGTYEQTAAMIATRLFTGESLDSGWTEYSFCIDDACEETFETDDLLEAIEYALTEWGYL